MRDRVAPALYSEGQRCGLCLRTKTHHGKTGQVHYWSSSSQSRYSRCPTDAQVIIRHYCADVDARFLILPCVSSSSGLDLLGTDTDKKKIHAGSPTLTPTPATVWDGIFEFNKGTCCTSKECDPRVGMENYHAVSPACYTIIHTAAFLRTYLLPPTLAICNECRR